MTTGYVALYTIGGDGLGIASAATDVSLANRNLALGTGSLTATNLTGTLQTAVQTNVTSLGTLTALSTAGAVAVDGSQRQYHVQLAPVFDSGINVIRAAALAVLSDVRGNSGRVITDLMGIYVSHSFYSYVGLSLTNCYGVYHPDQTFANVTTPLVVPHSRRHEGLIAQEVAVALADHGLGTSDFGGYVDPKINDPTDTSPLGLRYEEFIGPIIKSVQELDQRCIPVFGTPVSSTAPGNPGEQRYDNDFMYTCVSPNMWTLRRGKLKNRILITLYETTRGQNVDQPATTPASASPCFATGEWIGGIRLR